LGSLSCIFSSSQIEVVGVVIYRQDGKLKRSIARKVKDRVRISGLRKIIRAINTKIYYKIEGTFHSTVKIPAEVYFKGKGVPILCTSQRYSDETVTFIRFQRPYAMFAMDFGLIKEPLLSLTPKGVISYHHGDFRKYRGIPACFWPMYNGETEMKVTAQILSTGIDCGPIVKEKVIPIHRTDNLRVLNRRAYVQAYPMIADACKLLDSGKFIPQKLPKTELGPVYTAPTPTQWVKFIVRVNLRKFKWIFTKRQCREKEEWGI